MANIKKEERIKKAIKLLESEGYYICKEDFELANYLEENFEYITFKGSREAIEFVKEIADVVENVQDVKELCYKYDIEISENENISIGELESGIRL
jgi:hypothetical protein